MRYVFAAIVAILLTVGCSSAPTYTVVTQKGDVYQASTEPVEGNGGYATFDNMKGKKIRIKEEDVKSITEN